MRALLQRVTEASVRKVENNELVGTIGPGLLVFFCAMEGDGQSEVELLAHKISRMRIFEDDAGKMNLSVIDTAGAILAVSQFTLAADSRRGNRPSFSAAASIKTAEILYEAFVSSLRSIGIPVETGQFRSQMHIASVNDGPVSVWVDTASYLY
tara:strand:+ start:181 stop:639 length:459 start_codon:yes stop_codon:yes gene_type:complete